VNKFGIHRKIFIERLESAEIVVVRLAWAPQIKQKRFRHLAYTLRLKMRRCRLVSGFFWKSNRVLVIATCSTRSMINYTFIVPYAYHTYTCTHIRRTKDTVTALFDDRTTRTTSRECVFNKPLSCYFFIILPKKKKKINYSQVVPVTSNVRGGHQK
jgi:hypothetical protein